MKTGVIGGSGIYDLENLEAMESVSIETPFGAPSDRFVRGRVGADEVWFLPRHGRGHRILPSEINHRANIYALKSVGVERVISISAVGSLREGLRPRDVVLPDQYYDRTKQSTTQTFFGAGIVAHIGFGNPCCADLRSRIADCARRLTAADECAVQVVNGGTYVNMEGPAFSTRAESNAYRAMGFDVIGMTSLPEAKLCREAEICYQSLAMVTDYDCWHASEAEVSVATIVAHLQANADLARRILAAVIPTLPDRRDCDCAHALATALLTDRDAITEAAKTRLDAILRRYLET